MRQSGVSTLNQQLSPSFNGREELALIFAYHFPPDNAIGAARPFRFYKYLSRMGYRCHVITAAPVAERPDLDAEYVGDPFVTNPREGFGWQVERSVRKFLVPGVVGTQWAVRAYRSALRFLNENPGYQATIISTFPPMGTHLCAYWLARQAGLPWIADFRDPLADNPGNAVLNPLTAPIYRKLEQIFIRSADYVIANTDAAAEKLRQCYPDRAGRIQLIWNGFDPEERLEPIPVPPRDFHVLAHVGELYGGRNVTPILHSVKRLIDRGELSPTQFQVHLIGPVMASAVPDPVFIAAATEQGWLNMNTARVSQVEAHKIVQTANSLLIIQPQSALQVPGKLFEYLQMGRPILAFVPPDSPVERILQHSGVPYECVYPTSSPNEIDASLLRFFSLESRNGKPNSWFENEFNAEHHAGKVAELIRSVSSSRNRA